MKNIQLKFQITTSEKMKKVKLQVNEHETFL